MADATMPVDSINVGKGTEGPATEAPALPMNGPAGNGTSDGIVLSNAQTISAGNPSSTNGGTLRPRGNMVHRRDRSV